MVPSKNLIEVNLNSRFPCFKRNPRRGGKKERNTNVSGHHSMVIKFKKKGTFYFKVVKIHMNLVEKNRLTI